MERRKEREKAFLRIKIREKGHFLGSEGKEWKIRKFCVCVKKKKRKEIES